MFLIECKLYRLLNYCKSNDHNMWKLYVRQYVQAISIKQLKLILEDDSTNLNSSITIEPVIDVLTVCKPSRTSAKI
jgi:hypothetical protein